MATIYLIIVIIYIYNSNYMILIYRNEVISMSDILIKRNHMEIPLGTTT